MPDRVQGIEEEAVERAARRPVQPRVSLGLHHLVAAAGLLVCYWGVTKAFHTRVVISLKSHQVTQLQFPELRERARFSVQRFQARSLEIGNADVESGSQILERSLQHAVRIRDNGIESTKREQGPELL